MKTLSVSPALLRDHFPVFQHKVYLNTCSYGAIGLEVEAALNAYVALRKTVGADWGLWTKKVERLRELLANVLGGVAEDIAISTSLSESVNSIASALDFTGMRHEVIITEFDFPTTSQIWHAQRVRGAKIVEIPASIDGTQLLLESFEGAINDRTLLVSIPHVCYWNGARVDIEPIIELAHRRGAYVLLDVFQSVGTFPFNCRELGADFVAGGCTKYLLGSAGIGFSYIRDSVKGELQPTATGWLAQADPSAMNIHEHAPARDARRFEAGTPNVPGLYAAEAGIEIVNALTVDRIWGSISALCEIIRTEAARAGYHLATPMDSAGHGALMAIRANDADSLVSRLAADDIVVTCRRDNIRVSVHFYNSVEDIEALFRSLRRHQSLLVR